MEMVDKCFNVADTNHGFVLRFILLAWKEKQHQIISYERVAEDNTR